MPTSQNKSTIVTLCKLTEQTHKQGLSGYQGNKKLTLFNKDVRLCYQCTLYERYNNIKNRMLNRICNFISVRGC